MEPLREFMQISPSARVQLHNADIRYYEPVVEVKPLPDCVVAGDDGSLAELRYINVVNLAQFYCAHRGRSLRFTPKYYDGDDEYSNFPPLDTAQIKQMRKGISEHRRWQKKTAKNRCY